MHYVEAKSILSAKNGMNLYRGCQHGCIYCDSRSTCYQMNHDFEDIEVKENSLVLLENALQGKKKKAMIGMGSMTDPYIPLEENLRYTRRAMEIVNRYGFGFTSITKSDRVMRDIDVFKEINQNSKAVLQMTLTTYDDELCKIIEPGVSVTSRRFEVLKAFQGEGIPTVVWLCPILPYINDTEENIKGILEYCIEAGVKGVICFGMGLTLREGNREYFYKKLSEHFPELPARYAREFGNSYVLGSPDNDKLMRIFHETCEKHGIMHNNDEIFKYLSTFEEKYSGQQLSFF